MASKFVVLLVTLNISLLSLLASPVAFAAATEESATVVTADGLSLRGVLALPEKVSGAALILPGSGNVGADGDLSGPLLGSGFKGAPAKLSEQIAASLAANGIASLRYFKRGFDDSTRLSQQTIPYLVQDARSALQVLRARFPEAKIGIVGLSEGALVATLVASQAKVDFLQLMSLSTRSIDDTLAYQFLEWPTELVRRKVDLNQDGMLSAAEISQAGGQVPLLGVGFSPGPAMSLDTDHKNWVSVTNDLIAAYEKLLDSARQLVETPAFSGWYHSLKDLPPFSTFAEKVVAPAVLYQGVDDAQVKWSDVAADLHYFGGKTTFRLYSGLGHCFAPMAGGYGEMKTSGPIADSVLSNLAADALKLSGGASR